MQRNFKRFFSVNKKKKRSAPYIPSNAVIDVCRSLLRCGKDF